MPFYAIILLVVKLIKEKRKSLGFTQAQMALSLNISLRQYVRIDNEEDLPRRDVLKKLITLLNLSDNEIGTYIREISQKIA